MIVVRRCALATVLLAAAAAAVAAQPGADRADTKVITVDLGGVTMEFVRVPRGTFWMGSPRREAKRDDDEGQHEVEISHDFYLGRYEVTQAQYTALTNAKPSAFAATGKNRAQVDDMNTDNFPVDSVSWDDAVKFCALLNRRDAKSGRAYRLPTEAEWEYAARGGATGRDSLPFHLADGPTGDLGHGQANFNTNYPYAGGAKADPLRRPCSVGLFPPNRFGLYDMHG